MKAVDNRIKSNINTRCLLIISFLVLFHAVNNFFWLNINSFPPAWDESLHLLNSLNMMQVLSGFFHNFSGEYLQTGWSYPPFFYMVSAVVGLLFNNSLISLVMTNIIFLAILLFSVFKIGEILYDRYVGLLATFLISMYPIIFGTSRVFLIDCSLCAMVSLAICFLLLANNFNNRFYSILFGVALGLGMLTRVVFIIYIIGPLIYILRRALMLRTSNRHKKRINIMVSLGVASLFLSVWYPEYILNYFSRYSPNSNFLSVLWSLRKKISYFPIQIVIYFVSVIILIALSIFRKFHKNIIGFSKYINICFGIIALSISPMVIILFKMIVPGMTFSRAQYYISTWNSLSLRPQIGYFFSILFIIGIFYIISKDIKHKALLLSWVVVPYMFFGIFFLVGRFVVPYLPVIALISAIPISKLKNTIAKRILVFFIIVFSLIQFYRMSFYFPRYNHPLQKMVKNILMAPSDYILVHPANASKINEVVIKTLAWVEKDKSGKKANIGLIVDQRTFNEFTMRYYIFSNSFDLDVVNFVNLDASLSSRYRPDYILALRDPREWYWRYTFYESKKKRIVALHNFLKKDCEYYNLVKQIPFRRNNVVKIYKKRGY